MDGGAWWATVHGVTKSQTLLSDLTFTFPFIHISSPFWTCLQFPHPSKMIQSPCLSFLSHIFNALLLLWKIDRHNRIHVMYVMIQSQEKNDTLEPGTQFKIWLLPLKSSVWPALVLYIFWNKNHLISEPQASRLRLVGWELWKRFGAVHPAGADESSERWESYHLLEEKGSVPLLSLFLLSTF